MRTLLCNLIVISALTAALYGQSRAPQHPLDALTTEEYWTVHDVLAQSGHLSEKTLFSSVLMHEPVKDKVLA